MTAETVTSDPTELHAVFYTDGGCRPTSRGMGGWGLHGYLYHKVPTKVGTGCKAAMTEAGYVPHGANKAKSEITIEEYVDGFGALPDSTNNAAEISAFKRALEICETKGVVNTLILSDSKYTLDGHGQWMHSWERSGWRKRDGGEIPNGELWQSVHQLDKHLKSNGVVIRTQHVKGHDGNLGNETADQMATSGVISGFNGSTEEVLIYSDPKGYWSSSRDNNRMLSHPFCYFSTHEHVPTHAPDGRKIYYTGKIKRDDLEMIGKKISDSSLAILYLKEADPAMEVVTEAFETLGAGRYQGLLIADLGNVLKPETREDLIRFRTRLLTRDFVNRRLIVGKDNSLLGEEAYPPRLSFRLVDTFNMQERMFQSYLRGSEAIVTTTDITDILYETGSAEKATTDAKSAAAKKVTTKLKPSIKPGHRTLTVSANYVKASGGIGAVDLVLILDQDIPDRNTLAALADDGIKVTLLTWPESDKAIRFATVIEVNGDAAIWSGAYANLKLVAP